VSRQALVAYRGNRYSVPPGLAGAVATNRLVGAEFLDIARHLLAAEGAGVVVRDHGHVAVLNRQADLRA
jgi:hypothetical protein